MNCNAKESPELTRHRHENRLATSLRLPESLMERVDRYVTVNKKKRYGETLSRNNVIEQALTEFLDRQDTKSKKERW